MGTPASLGLEDLTRNYERLERIVSDHTQKFDTLETVWWKRIWFWLDGWPHHRLNAERRSWRPWHRGH